MAERLEGPDEEAEGGKMPLMDHLVELRRRLVISIGAFIVCFFVGYAVAEPIYQFLVEPLAQLLDGQQGRRMIYTALHEAFFTYVKVGFFFAACISFPIVSIQIWLFIAPGLYKHERKALMPFLAATPFLFLLGASMVYYIVIPLAWQFFLGFESPGTDGNLAIVLEPKVGEYLSLVMRLIFAFGVAFELPVLLVLLARVGLTTAAGLASKRRYAIVIAFVAAAILTPPDVISQVLLAVPIIVLYEISIICARFIEKKREDDAALDDEPDPDPKPGGGSSSARSSTGGDEEAGP
ncbi:MAG: twin-arginine translocase subunit TatC [Alphaproteobacteria bacterium]|nr:twin-arginine translocase subunit TatC [Alphaproteobacteria bacterium]